MKYFLIPALCLFSLAIYGQEIAPEFDGHKWEAPYELPIPKDWEIERFPIPISFAPEIAYNGVEDIRFAPGWGKVSSDQYWTYAFLWYLDGSPVTNAEVIAENLEVYYTGLIKSNTDSARATKGIVIPVTASFEKTSTYNCDLETYAGTIGMTDFLQGTPITLHCIVHLKTCVEGNKTIIFYELSPKPFTHPNWLELHQFWSGFRCNKADTLK